ncbi:MAG TPA: BatA domain-containing protein, partial [Verrucomicrobiae bacterium]|nr:BatA domain-containing protein [Verrucomicrobiae bacterium]
MSFLTPWFLLGAAAIAGPILFHLIRQSVRERMPFSSLMFLRPTTQRVTRRRKLEDLWLLLLRCLCLMLLAIGFARPFFTNNIMPPATATEGRQLILLIDTSASMRREGVWEHARSLAERYLAQAAPGDQVAVLTFDRQTHTLVNFAEWSSCTVDQRAELARQRLAAVSPGWMGTQLGLALTGAAEKFTDDSLNGKPVSRRELVLISDLQEGAKLDGLQGHEWPAGVQVVIERAEAKPQSNAGLEIQNPANDDSPVRVRVTNARDSDREKFQLSWQLAKQTPFTNRTMEIYLPPGQTRSYATPMLPAGTTTAELQLSGDEADFDNRSYFATPEAEHLTIAWFGPDTGNDPQNMRYYLQRVFPEIPARQVKVVSPVIQQAFSPDLLNQAAFAIIPGRMAPEEITAAHDWLAHGKTALFVVTDEQSASSLRALTDLAAINITEAAGDYA